MPTRLLLKQLQQALLVAFPNKSSLERLLYFELEKNLDEITRDSDLQEIAFRLIQTADSQGWLVDLVRAARKENPGNSQLSAIATELLNPPKSPSLFVSYISPQPNLRRLSHTSGEDDIPSPISEITPIKRGEFPLSEIPVSGNQVSEVNANYSGLRNLLQNRNLKEADFETTRVMFWIVNRRIDQMLSRNDFEDFPLLDLNTIDKLWLAGSNNKFGFSVQKQIWIDKGGNPGEYTFQKFRSFVGDLEWERESVSCDLRSKRGHLPKGLYVLTRIEELTIVEKYKSEYDEFINKLIEIERKRVEMLEQELERERTERKRVEFLLDVELREVVDDSEQVGHRTFKGGHLGGSLAGHGRPRRRPPEDPYFFLLKRLVEFNT